ncbi:LysR substrate-binding domain-containing protein [Neptunicoccus sediminis]|uniref:LysR substrate-binding domain-containing protein n=1 Tax=Neptunicoccus sediminis TaxID=1892596 RepID=UPI000845F4EF|nr:LysR substrate-binding domain-containing protein [Neptunicoccus sediminis]
MARTLPPLNALRAFESAARLNSFTRAARELNVSHSAISRHVRGLEKRLDVALFRAVARGVELTPDGQWYLERIGPAFDAIAEATDGLTDVPAGQVILSCEPSIAQKWLIPRMGRFNALHPDVRITLTVTDRLANVANHDCDIALRYVSEGVDVSAYDEISRAPVYPYAKPGFADLDPDNLDLAVLARQHLIQEHTGLLWPMWFRAAGVIPDRPLNLSTPLDAVLGIEAAISGLGAILMSAELTSVEVEAGRLIKLSDVGVQSGGYYLLTNATAARRKAVKVFRDWMLAESAAWRTR